MDFSKAVVVPVNGEGPEDVLADADGRIYSGLADGRIVRISDSGATVETIAACPARPLGLEFFGEDELVVCASEAGLLAVSISTGAVRTLADSAAGTPILACNNAAVAADGSIYFSDSSAVYTIAQWRAESLHQTRTGRLLRRSPDGDIDELMTGLNFANGVALAPDESFVLVAESNSCRIHRVWLTADQLGTTEVFLDDLSGYPDNISIGSDGLFWIAIPTPKVPALDRLRRLPAPLRSLILRLPDSLQPPPSHTVEVIGVGGDREIVQSIRGEVEGFYGLTGVEERDGVLYCGSLVAHNVIVMSR